MPFSDESVWATPWGRWLSSHGTSGEKPIPEALKQIELYWDYQATPDKAKQEDLFRQILAIAKEQFWGIGIGTAPATYWVAKNRVKNIIGGVPDTYVYRTPGHANPEQWFLADQA